MIDWSRQKLTIGWRKSNILNDAVHVFVPWKTKHLPGEESLSKQAKRQNKGMLKLTVNDGIKARPHQYQPSYISRRELI